MQGGPNDAIVYVVVAGSRGVRFLVRRQKDAPLEQLACDLTGGEGSAGTADMIVSYPQSGSHSDEQRARNEARQYHIIARQIDELLGERAGHHLILCAPPRQLCLLRDYISNRTRQAIVCERTVDLSGAGIQEIEAHLG